MSYLRLREEPAVFLDEDLPNEYYSGLTALLQGKDTRTLEEFMAIETSYYNRFIKSRATIRKNFTAA